MESIEGSYPMPVLAVNFTATASRIKTKENTFVKCYDEQQFKSQEIVLFLFLERQKNTLSNKPLLWCFIIIEVVTCRRLLWICTARMQLSSVKEIANPLHCSVRGRKTKPVLICPASYTGFACLPPVVVQILFGEVSLFFSAVSLSSSGAD